MAKGKGQTANVQWVLTGVSLPGTGTFDICHLNFELFWDEQVKLQSAKVKWQMWRGF